MMSQATSEREAQARQVLARHLPNDGYVGPYSRDYVITAMLAFADQQAPLSQTNEALREALELIALTGWGWKGGGSDVRCRSREASVAASALGMGDLPLGWPSAGEYARINELRAALSPIPEQERTVAGDEGLRAGMVPWAGGQHAAPADWDRGPVQFRDGRVIGAPAGSIWKLGWEHCYGSGDLVAYTPKALTTPPIKPDEGEAVRIADRLVDQSDEPYWTGGNFSERMNYWRDKAIQCAGDLRTLVAAPTGEGV